MWIGALVGALALTVGTVSLASAQSRASVLSSYEAMAPSAPRVTEANIAKLKSVLHLTPHQLAHWGPVEQALRALAKEQRGSAAFAGDMDARTAAIAGMLNKMKRLSAAAAPLIQSLDEAQRRDAMMLVRHLGYDSLVASF